MTIFSFAEFVSFCFFCFFCCLFSFCHHFPFPAKNKLFVLSIALLVVFSVVKAQVYYRENFNIKLGYLDLSTSSL